MSVFDRDEYVVRFLRARHSRSELESLLQELVTVRSRESRDLLRRVADRLDEIEDRAADSGAKPAEESKQNEFESPSDQEAHELVERGLDVLAGPAEGEAQAGKTEEGAMHSGRAPTEPQQLFAQDLDATTQPTPELGHYPTGEISALSNQTRSESSTKDDEGLTLQRFSENWTAPRAVVPEALPNWARGEVEAEMLTWATDDEAHELHMAACEWDLDQAILIDGPDDLKARVHWKDVLEPFEHQIKNLITFCRRAPVALLADDVGLGKTISAGLILSELRARGKVQRALVVVPKVALMDQWKGELAERFHIPAECARGAELTQALRNPLCEVVITSYDSARNRLDGLQGGEFDMVILDEAHKLRNLHGQSSPPKTALVFESALADRKFRYVLMLTATPIQNRLWDLYSLVDLLSSAKGHINPLGSPDEFAWNYIADNRSSARELEPRMKGKFRQILSQYMVRTRRVDAGLVFPPREIQIGHANPSVAENELARIVAGVVGSLNALTQTSLLESFMSSPQATLAQLKNMSRTRPEFRIAAEEAEAVVSQAGDTAKGRFLVSIVKHLMDQNPTGWRLVVFTRRKETQAAIGALLSREIGEGQVGFIRGGDHRGNQRAIEGYRLSPPDIRVLVSTDAGTEGLNLQAGNVLVNYDLPWNPMVLEQRIGRVQRLGSEHKSVLIINLVLKGSVEERVVERLVDKLAVIADSLGDIEGILEGLPGNDGEGESFSSKIRELVVDSMQGRDVEASIRSIQRSIDRAKEIYDNEKKVVDEQLGRLDAMHDDGPGLPRLEPIEPRMTFQDFALGALARGEGDLVRESNGTLIYRRRGYAPEEVVFTREELNRRRAQGIAGGPRVSLYAPGQPAFEKLGEYWRRNSQHRVSRLAIAAPVIREQMAQEWLSTLGDGVELLALRHSADGEVFHGKLALRSAVSVEHDKYEKVTEAAVASKPVSVPLDGLAEPLATSLGLQDLSLERPSVEAVVAGEVASDPDLSKFAAFYVERYKEELNNAAGDPGLEARCRQSFFPSVSNRIVGASGFVSPIEKWDIEFRVESATYHVEVTAAPCSREFVTLPDVDVCSISKQVLPKICLGKCAVSGELARLDLGRESGISGRWAIESHTAVCGESDLILLADEAGKSDYSGKLVDLELLHASPLSGRMGVEAEFVSCEFSGEEALLDEVVESSVSQKFVRKDLIVQGGRSPVSGHESEFVRCSASGALLLPSEVGTSDVSGRVYDSELLVESARSGRSGGPDEVSVCSASGEALLSDETGMCSVTGQVVYEGLLGRSEVSGELVRLDLLHKCEVSGVECSSEECGKCSVTGKRVDRRLLFTSRATGKQALAEYVVRCEVSGDKAIQGELEQCQESGVKALPILLGNCSVSGMRALVTQMVRDDLGRDAMILRRFAKSSATSGRWSRSECTAICQWDGLRRLEDELGVCVYSGLSFGLDHLGKDGYLRAFEPGYRGGAKGESVEEVRQWSPRPDFTVKGIGFIRKLDACILISSPSGELTAVRGLRKRLLGFSKECLSFLMTSGGQAVGQGHIESA
jgi:superfamily II DNA or RNA helicase